jgi:serine/threonine protein kinase
MSYRLVIEKGRSKGKALRLKPSGTVVIGRESNNQLVVSDPQISRRHFELVGKLGEFVLKDLKSSNGTFVNGERTRNHTLKPGDKIALGDTLVYFLEETQEEDAKNRRGELTGREIAGYRIGRLLGRGGMGTVYEAVQISLERTVAFKTLAPELTNNPEFIERFISEARAAGRLSHANIVAVFDVGHEGDQYFYSMEYMAGGSVDDLLRHKGPLSLETSIPIIFDAARGLEYAEKHGLIHRDIKPDNLMLGVDDVVKICDLGLATFSSQQREVSGSPHYIAPEQALGKDIDHRADLYALGVSWYQLLCGETPFTGRSPEEIARKHVEEAPPSLAERAPETPPEVIALIDQLMAKNPDDRMASARQLQADLAELARRYPIRETVMLRIDAVAPDQPPSEALLDSVPETGGSSSALSYVALALVAVALLASAFIVTSLYIGGSNKRVEEANTRVQELATLLSTGQFSEAHTRGLELTEQLADAGLDQQAKQARVLTASAKSNMEQAQKNAVEAAARESLAAAEKVYRENGVNRSLDPALRARLERTKGLLDALITEFSTTEAAAEAQVLRDEVQAGLDELAEAQKRLAKRQAEARKQLELTKQGIETLLKHPRAGAFKQALDRAREYAKRFGDIESRGGVRLEQLVRERTSRAVRHQTSLALQHIGQSQWSEAREALASVHPPLGFSELDTRVTDVEETLRQQIAAGKRGDSERDTRADEARIEASIAKIAPAINERRFSRAASDFRGEAPHLKTPAARRLAAARTFRLEAASRSIALLVGTVRKGDATIELELEFPRKGKKLARAVEVDVKGRRFTFEHSPYIRSMNIDEFEATQLLGFFDSIALSTSQRLDLACLAYELKQPMKGAQLLQEVGSLDPSLRKEVEDMIALSREQ